MNYIPCFRDKLVCGYRPASREDQVVIFEVAGSADLPHPSEPLDGGKLFTDYWLKAVKPAGRPRRRSILFFPPAAGHKPDDYARFAADHELWGRLYYWTSSGPDESRWSFPGGSAYTAVRLGTNLYMYLEDEYGPVELEWLDDLSVKWTASGGLALGGRKPASQSWVLTEDDGEASVSRARSTTAVVDLEPLESENSGALLIACSEDADPLPMAEISFSRVKEDDGELECVHELRGRPLPKLGRIRATCAVDLRDHNLTKFQKGLKLRSRVEFKGELPIASGFCSDAGETVMLRPQSGQDRGLLRLQLRADGGYVDKAGGYTPYDSPAIFVPEGTFLYEGLADSSGGTGNKSSARVLWGGSVTEFTELHHQDRLVFLRNYPAVLSGKDSGNYSTSPRGNGTPPDQIARLENLGRIITTPWLQILRGQSMAAEVGKPVYVTEPVKGPQFGKGVNLLTPDNKGLERANLRLGDLDDCLLPAFPMLGRIRDSAGRAATSGAGAAAGPDASHLAEARRMIIRPPDGSRPWTPPSGKAPRSLGPQRGVTPQGILVDRDAHDNYRRLYFGSAEPDLVDENGNPSGTVQPEFTLGIDPGTMPAQREFHDRLQLALRASDLFMVVSNPTADAMTVLKPLAGVRLRKFEIKVDTYQAGQGGVMIVKYFKHNSLKDLLGDEESLQANLWACRDDLAPGCTAAELRRLLGMGTLEKENWYGDFKRIWESREWQGILFINVTVGDMPDIFTALEGGIGEKNRLRFHHLGLNFMPVKSGDLKPAQAPRLTAAFGVLRYAEDPNGGEPQWDSADVIPRDEPEMMDGKPVIELAVEDPKPEYRFNVKKLSVSFFNSRIRTFEADVEVSFSQLFWDATDEKSPGGKVNPLLLKGSYEARPTDTGTVDLFRLRLIADETLKFEKNSWLDKFHFAEAEFSVTSSEVVDGQKTVHSFLGISGTLHFNQEGFPGTSFVILKSITVSKMGAKYIYRPKSSGSPERKVSFKIEDANVDADLEQGSNPLLALLPIKFKGFRMALGEFSLNLKKLNFFPITGFDKAGIHFDFGIKLEFDFGSFGRLAGFKDFKLPALFGWKRGLKGFAFGIQFPNLGSGEVNLSLLGFIGLKIKQIETAVCGPEGGGALALVMRQIQLVFFGKSWPTDSQFSLGIFMGVGKERKLAWMAGLENDSIPVIDYVGAGYRVKVPENLENTTRGVVDGYRKFLTLKPDEDSNKDGSPCDWVAKQDNAKDGWVLVSKLGYEGIFDAWLAISDVQDIYGLRLDLAGLFELDAFYRRIADGLGVYSCDFNLQKIIPPLQVGVATLTVPSVLVEVYTDGGYYIDFGYPRGADFTRSFKIEVAIFTGGGGFYFGSRALAAVSVLKLGKKVDRFLPPKDSSEHNAYLKQYRAVSAGIKFRGGIGRSFNAGILKAEAVLAFYGSIEGAVASRGSSRPSLWAVSGTVGILFTITAEVDFVVLQAKASLLAYAETGFIFRKVLGYCTEDGKDRFYHITLPVTFFVEVGLHIHVEVWVTIGCVKVKLFDFEFRGSWRMEIEAGGFSGSPADGGSSFYLRDSRQAILASSGGWTRKFNVWTGTKDMNLLATVIPCVTARADLPAPPDDQPYHGSMVAQLVSLPGHLGGFALLSEFIVRWALEAGSGSSTVTHAWLKYRRAIFREDDPWQGDMAEWILENLKRHLTLKLTPLTKDDTIDSYVGLPLWPDVSWSFDPSSGGSSKALRVSSRNVLLPEGRGLAENHGLDSGSGHRLGDGATNLFIDYLRAVTNSFLDEIDRYFVHESEKEAVPQGTLERSWSQIWAEISGTNGN